MTCLALQLCRDSILQSLFTCRDDENLTLTEEAVIVQDLHSGFHVFTNFILAARQ